MLSYISLFFILYLECLFTIFHLNFICSFYTVLVMYKKRHPRFCTEFKRLSPLPFIEMLNIV
jgi:hypothetical protein